MMLFFKSNTNRRIAERGQAALIAVVFMLAITLSAVFGVISLAFSEVKVASENIKAKNSYFTAEAGIEDVIYRFKSGKAVGGSYALTINGSTADITVTAISGAERNILSAADSSGSNRSVSVNLYAGTTGANFYYGVQVGDGGLDMGENTRINGNVYANGNITGGNGATITGTATVAGGISSSPSTSYEIFDQDFNFATAQANRDAAQSFIADASDKLNKVAVYLGKAGTPSSAITLRIVADDAGEPDRNDIASVSIPLSSVGQTPSWVNASFASPPTLVAGNKYWIILDYGTNSASNYWIWKKDSANGYAGNKGMYSDDWDANNADWTDVGGDLAFQVWIGGISTKIEGLIIGNSTTGSGHANLFVSDNIHGSNCPNQYCVVENPPREELPLPDGVIEDWRQGAASGGLCVEPECDANGNFNLTTNGSIATLGPVKITGDLNISNNSTLTVNGTIYVMGDINFSNGCTVRLSSAYGPLSGIIFADGNINISNNCSFAGSGSAGSYVMLLSARNAPAEHVISVDNNSQGVIYYAGNGRINFSNNAAAKEATAYGIDLSNNATITYESGLADVNFASGPSGGWDIRSWQEIIP